MELNCYDANGNPVYGYEGESRSCANVCDTDSRWMVNLTWAYTACEHLAREHTKVEHSP